VKFSAGLGRGGRVHGTDLEPQGWVCLASEIDHHRRQVDPKTSSPSSRTFIASTNAREDKKELDDLWAAAASDVLGAEHYTPRISLSSRFSLDDAPELLRRHFADVQVSELPGTITVREPEPVIAHLASYRAWADSAGVAFDPTLHRARRMLESVIDRDGDFRISCRGAILICQTAR